MRPSKVSIGRTWVRYGFAFLVAAFAFLASVSIDFGGASSTFGSHESVKHDTMVISILNEAEAGKAKITAKSKKKSKKSTKNSKKNKNRKSKIKTKSREPAKKQRPIVLSGGASKRSEPVGKKYGYSTYSPWKNKAISTTKMLKRNERWLRDQMRSGRKIYDVGMPKGRSLKQHIFYAKEKQILQSSGYRRVKRGRVSVKVNGKMSRMRKYEWIKD